MTTLEKLLSYLKNVILYSGFNFYIDVSHVRNVLVENAVLNE